MNAILLVVCFAFALPTASAQKPPVRFDDISIEDMTMPYYEGDSSASAVVLADYPKRK